MNNSTASSPAPRAIKFGYSSGQPKGGHGTGTDAGETEPQTPYGARIAQTALWSVGMWTTRNFGGPITGPPEYAEAVSIIFTKATE